MPVWHAGDSVLVRGVFESRIRIAITSFGASHSLALFWDARSDEFLGWYVDLQAPLRPSSLGWDTRDHALDVWIDPELPDAWDVL